MYISKYVWAHNHTLRITQRHCDERDCYIGTKRIQYVLTQFLCSYITLYQLDLTAFKLCSRVRLGVCIHFCVFLVYKWCASPHIHKYTHKQQKNVYTILLIVVVCVWVCVCSCIVHWASYNKTQVEHSVFQIIANWLYSSFCSFVCLYIDFVNGTYNKCWIMYIFVVYDVSTFCIYINSTLPATQVYLPNARCISDYELYECVVWCGVRLFDCVCVFAWVRFCCLRSFVSLCLLHNVFGPTLPFPTPPHTLKYQISICFVYVVSKHVL